MGAGTQRNLAFSIDRGGTFTDVYAEVRGRRLRSTALGVRAGRAVEGASAPCLTLCNIFVFFLRALCRWQGGGQ